MAIQIVAAPDTETPPTPEPTTKPTLKPPTLLLFGRNRGGKPCAAWFDGEQAEAASAAAATMKLHVLSIADDEGRALAAKFAQGRILSSGKAHVPGARRDLYGRLVDLAGINTGLNISERPEQREAPAAVAGEGTKQVLGEPQPTAVAGDPDRSERAGAATTGTGADANAADGPAKPKFGDHNFVGSPIPREREEIGLGSVVLALEEPAEGWWEAEVVGMNGRVFSLRWRDYPQQGTILRQPGELALMPPGKA